MRHTAAAAAALLLMMVPGMLLVGATGVGAAVTRRVSTATPFAPLAGGATMSAVHVVGHCTAAQSFNCVGFTTNAMIPNPSAGQILIKVAGSSVNPCDSDTVRGKPGCPLNSAGVPGGDVAGTVVQCPGCVRLKVGDAVWANRFGLAGGMAEYALATELQTGLAPRNLVLADAGTIPIVGGTSLQCLRCLEPVTTQAAAAVDRVTNPCHATSSKRPLENMTIVITSGSGGTGYLAVQMARALGAAEVITTTSGSAAIHWMKQLGATTVCDVVVSPQPPAHPTILVCVL
jgi:NADPH:quinone reductase-like Zn-dependent oxidoreductase|eukprot:COSAG01_NODE_4879_length_4656_cov_5.636384_3_plen_288_part_00